MGYHLAQGVYLCVHKTGPAVLLDVNGNRYWQAGRAASDALRKRVASPSADLEQALDGLVEAKMMDFTPGQTDRIGQIQGTSARRDLTQISGGTEPLRATDAIAILALTARTALLVRRSGFKAVLPRRGAERADPRPRRDIERAVELGLRYVAVQYWLPWRPRCLLDSLVLRRWAESHGVAVQLVVGVRPEPFAAHCWVQVDDIVLNDTADEVAQFTPLLMV